MKQKQLRRLAKAARKMRRIQEGNLSNDEIINNFAYMLKTYQLLHKEEKVDEEPKNEGNNM